MVEQKTPARVGAGVPTLGRRLSRRKPVEKLVAETESGHGLHRTMGFWQLSMIGIGATLGGAVMGDHCSPISDTTIMASTGAQCYHLNHVATQLPYAVTVAAVAFVNYIIAGMIQNVVIDLIIAVVSMVVVMLIIGKVNHSMNIHSQRD